MWMSCSTTRATRRSRKVWEARSMHAAAAFSHDSLLVPTKSITLYTLSAMLLSFRHAVILSEIADIPTRNILRPTSGIMQGSFPLLLHRHENNSLHFHKKLLQY